MRNLILLMFCLIFLASCKREDTTWNTSWKAPLLTASLGFENMLGDSLIARGDSGSLIFVWRKSLSSLFFDDLVAIPDTSNLDYFSIPFGTITLGPGDPILAQVEDIQFAIPNADITYAKVKSGSVRFRLVNQIAQAIQVNYAIPPAKKNGQSISINQLVPAASGGVSGTYSSQIDISGYELDLRGQAQNSSNTLFTNLSGTINPYGSSVLVSSQDSLILEVVLEDIVLEYARGYFGNQRYNSGVVTTPFGLFNNRESGELQPGPISARLLVQNYAGFDAQLKLRTFKALNSRTGLSNYLQNSLVGNFQQISRATDNPLTPVSYSWNLGSGFSNLSDLFSLYPNYFQADFELEINPMGNVSGGNDFLYTERAFEVDLEVEAPVQFFLDELVLADTLEVRLPADSLSDRLENLQLDLVVENDFPFSTTIEFYEFESGVPGHLLVDQIFIGEGKYSPSGISSPFTAVIPLPVSNGLRDYLKTRRQVLAIVRLDAAPGVSPVKVYEGNRLDLTVVARADAEIKSAK